MPAPEPSATGQGSLAATCFTLSLGLASSASQWPDRQDRPAEGRLQHRRNSRVPRGDRSRDSEPSAELDRAVGRLQCSRSGAELPIPRTMNVIASSRNTIATAPVVRSEAKNIRDVKIPHVHRYRPSTLSISRRDALQPDRDEEVERDPERAVRAERDRSERVAGAELPDPGDKLGDTAVGERHAENAGQRVVVDQVGVDHAEHERGRGEPGEPERRRVRRDPAGSAAGVGIGYGAGATSASRPPPMFPASIYLLLLG